MYSFYFSLIARGSIVSFTWVKLKSEKYILWSGRFDWGVYCKFYLGKSDLGISMFSMCTGISLYFLIS